MCKTNSSERKILNEAVITDCVERTNDKQCGLLVGNQSLGDSGPLPIPLHNKGLKHKREPGEHLTVDCGEINQVAHEPSPNDTLQFQKTSARLDISDSMLKECYAGMRAFTG